MSDCEKPSDLTRRTFLRRTGWAAIGLTAIAAAGYPYLRSAIPALPSFSDPEIGDGWAWVQMLPNGRVRFYCPRMEMGQGANLGLTQIVAEELNVAQGDIECLLPDTGQTAPIRATVGSESIVKFFQPVSLAAARLREELRKRAARQAGLKLAEVEDGEGGFILPGAVNTSYGDLVQKTAIVLPEPNSESAIPIQYALGSAQSHQNIGQRWKHPDLQAIVTGTQVYSRDVVVPDMVYGHVMRPPKIGARIVKIDTGRAEHLPGLIKIVEDKARNFIGFVCDNPFILDDVAEAIEVTWHSNEDVVPAGRAIAEKCRATNAFPHVIAANGDTDGEPGGREISLSGAYFTPLVAHTAMEPRASVVSVSNGKVEVWCGSQDPFFVQQRVAKAIGFENDAVNVHSLRMGGGFGGRLACWASEDAAVLSNAIQRPVRVQWSREDEQRHNYFQPPFSHFIDAQVDSAGIITRWNHDCVSAPIITGPFSFMGMPLADAVTGVVDWIGPDKGTMRGIVSPYALPNHRIRFASARTGIPVGAYRGLGAAPNAFAVESMIDELAFAAKVDPLRFRLDNLSGSNARLAVALKRVSDMADWGSDLPENTGRGIACAIYKDMTYVAVIADIFVDHDAKTISATNIWCAQDCGLIINPDQVENLVTGNLIWGCSMAFKEKMTFASGIAQEDNFHSYEILRHGEAPDMHVSLIDSEAVSTGVGESAFAPVAPAIANAIFNAAGRRVRSLPISYDDVAGI